MIKNKDVLRKFSAGLFFILSLVLISGMIFTVGIERGLTEPKVKMTVLFYKVGGLTIGAPVTLSGVNVGTVADIDFLDQEVDGRGVKVTLSLFKRYQKQLHKTIYFAIITEGILGEKIIEITTDPGFYRADLSQPVVGEDPLDVQNLAETFGEAAVALLETSKTLDEITKEMKKISNTTTRVLNRVEQRIIDGSLFKVF